MSTQRKVLERLHELVLQRDADGTLNIDVPAFLKEIGWPNTAKNRDEVTMMFGSACRRVWPNAQINIDSGPSDN